MLGQMTSSHRCNRDRPRLRAYVADPSSQPCLVWIPWSWDPLASVYLWYWGCFGKGALSRSQPTWWRRQLDYARQQQPGQLHQELETLAQPEDGHSGGVDQRRMPLDQPSGLAPEDVTRLRRQQRQAARQRQHPHQPYVRSNEGMLEPRMDALAIPSRHGCGPPENSLLPPILVSTMPLTAVAPLAASDGPVPHEPNSGLELEMYRLTLEETFYLAWALNSLDVYTHPHQASLNSEALWSIFTQQPDGAFLYRYVAYHYYRSRGWTVRSGFKFACDFVLYQRQFPSQSHSQRPLRHQHAQYTVLVVPVRQQSYQQPEALGQVAGRGLVSNAPSATASSLSWDQLIAANRVTTQVQKRLILCYVDIPAQLEKLLLTIAGVGHPSSAWAALFAYQFGPCRRDAIADTLAQFRICEIQVARWQPERTR
ncbi:tRNA splicing endonuclease subunit sen2 [Dimargaris xerosporica]|nr:tRNA splicing endonuclease subunit sen2 [Dimargaris xerosporica]